MMGSNKPPTKPDDIDQEMLEWIRFREETLGPAAYAEGAGSKLLRKMKENPFVPLGAMATLGALTYGLWCFRKGRSRDSQIMMRARIAAQGFTVIAILGGIALGATTDHQKVGVNVKVEAAQSVAPTKT